MTLSQIFRNTKARKIDLLNPLSRWDAICSGRVEVSMYVMEEFMEFMEDHYPEYDFRLRVCEESLYLYMMMLDDRYVGTFIIQNFYNCRDRKGRSVPIRFWVFADELFRSKIDDYRSINNRRKAFERFTSEEFKDIFAKRINEYFEGRNKNDRFQIKKTKPQIRS